jgi:hypothetical protein
MNPDELIEDFIQKIDQWVENSGFVKTEQDLTKIEYILDRDPSEMKEMTAEDILIDTFSLYGYLASLQDAFNREKMVADFAEASIMSIVAPKLVPIHGDYTKHEVKYQLAIKDDALCCKLMKLSILAKARMNEVNGKISTITKMAEIMDSIAKRKKFKYDS